MARYFQTQRANIADADSFMYKPPMELLREAATMHDQGIAQGLSSAQLFENINVDYIDDPVEKAIVENAKMYYNDRSAEIIDRISKDPMSYKKEMLNIQNLAKELQQDMTHGELGKVQQSYKALQNFIQENADLKAKQPHIYNQGLNYYLNRWRSGENRSLDNTFTGSKLIGAPDITSEKYRKIFEGVKADSYDTLTGRYMYNNKEVTEQEMQEIAYGLLMQDPEVQSFVQQQQMFGDRGFVDVDQEGNVRAKSLYQAYDTNTGEILTPEQLEQKQKAYQALSQEDKRKLGPGYGYQLNREHGFYSGISAIGKAYSFREQKLEADEFAKIGYQGQVTRQNQAHQGQVTRSNQAHQYNLDVKKMEKEYELKDSNAQKGLLRDIQKIALDEAGTDAGKAAQDFLDRTMAQASVGAISTPTYSIDQLYSLGNSASPFAANLLSSVEQTARTNFFAKGGQNTKNSTVEFINFVDQFKKSNPDANENQIVKAFFQSPSSKIVNEEHFKSQGNKGSVMLPPDILENMYGERFKKHLENYNSNIDKALKNISADNASTQVSFVPFSTYGEKQALSLLNSSKQGFYYFDKDGNKVENAQMPNFKSVVNIGGNNVHETVAMTAVTEDGETVHVFPKNSREGSPYFKGVQSLLMNPSNVVGNNTAITEHILNGHTLDLTQKFTDKGFVKGERVVSLPIDNAGNNIQIIERQNADPSRKYEVVLPGKASYELKESEKIYSPTLYNISELLYKP